MKVRGILPSHVTETQVVLCKAAPTIRNAYEIRLALFMAVQSGRAFVMAVSPAAQVEQSLEAHIRQHGGDVVRADIREYSVYVGVVNREGQEGDGWVAGDSHLWASVLATVRSPWLRERLQVGATVATGELTQFQQLLGGEVIRARNVDDEDIHQALLRLSSGAIQVGGSVFIQ
jgi:hypothetical protein